MFDETHILRLLQTIKSTKNNAKLHQKAFQCTRDLISTHQNLIVRIIDSDSETCDEFMQSVSECEQILRDTLQGEQYKVSVSCGRLLYAIAYIALSKQKHDQNAMDTDVPAMIQMEPLIIRVIEAISSVEKVLQQNVDNAKRNKLGCIQDLLKIKAQCCALVTNWDFDSSFQQAYRLLSASDDQVAAVLLPYLSFLLQKCHKLPQWFPENAIEELKKRMDRSSVFVNIMKLLLRTTPSNNQLTQSVISLLHEYGEWDKEHQSFTENCWNLYLISMEAGCCGWFELMHIITKGLDRKTESETCYYWLKALSFMALAEQNLLNKATSKDVNLTVINPIASSIVKMKALQVLGQDASLQLYFIEARMEMILAVQQTLNVLNEPLHANETISRKFALIEECAKRFRKLATRLDPNDQPSFNFDKGTRNVLEKYNVCLLACEYASRSIASPNRQFCIDPTLIPFLLESKKNEDTLSRESQLSQLCKNLIEAVTNWSELSHLEHGDFYNACAMDMKPLLENILIVPLILPKAFFKFSKEALS